MRKLIGCNILIVLMAATMTFSSCHNEEAFGDLPPKSDIECVTDDTAHLRNTGAEGFLTGG
ncbi:MAG: hypothetical protein GY754_15385, partial [bacterium]|nr:hypothetical protein [bacterium]